MKILSVQPLTIPDVKIIKFARFADERGYFAETLRIQDLTTAPKLPELHDSKFYQMNESYSKKNVIRGLHIQWDPHMGKLVRVIDGSILDFALDVRVGSQTFGKIVIHELVFDLVSDSLDWIWVPPGFAHGFLTTSEFARIEYVCTGWWNPLCERGIDIFDGDIDWSLANQNLVEKAKASFPKAIMNDKDRNGLSLQVWKQSEDAQKFTGSLPKIKQ